MKYILIGVWKGEAIRRKAPEFEGVLTEMVEGVTYLLEVHVDKEVLEKEKIIRFLREEIESKFPTLTVKRIVPKDKIIYIEIVETGKPVPWSALLLFLPDILAAVGFVVTLIAVYLAVAEVPAWVIGLLLVGILLMAPKIGLLWIAMREKK